MLKERDRVLTCEKADFRGKWSKRFNSGFKDALTVCVFYESSSPDIILSPSPKAPPDGAAPAKAEKHSRSCFMC